MRRDRRQPCQWTTCASQAAARLVALASNSRQLMCQSSRGPVQNHEAACQLHVAHQLALEASIVTMTCRDTCSKGISTRRRTRSVQGMNERQRVGVMFTQTVPWRHAHFGTRECNLCWSGPILNNPSGDCSCGCHMPQEPLKVFQWYHHTASEGTQAGQHGLGTLVGETCHHTHESNSILRKEFLCTGESLHFSQLTRSPNRLRCRSNRSLWSHNCSRARAMLETVEDPDAHFP